MTNISIGQYYPVKSYIHSIDARVKLISTLFYIFLLFFINNVFAYLSTVIFISLVICVSRVPPKFMFKGLKGILIILFFTVTLNIFFTPGENIVFKYSFIVITYEGLIIAAQMAIRLVLLVVGTSVLTLTTTPIQLTDAIEFILKPLKKIGVPAHEIAMMMTIALRFIPTLLEEMDKIMKAQIARGADFDTGGIIKKAKSLIPILVPLFVSAFRRADDLAMAMEARCYRGDYNRTRMKQMKLTSIDFIAIAFFSCFSSVLIVSKFLLG